MQGDPAGEEIAQEVEQNRGGDRAGPFTKPAEDEGGKKNQGVPPLKRHKTVREGKKSGAEKKTGTGRNAEEPPPSDKQPL